MRILLEETAVVSGSTGMFSISCSDDCGCDGRDGGAGILCGGVSLLMAMASSED